MLLVTDVGNTNTAVGIFEGKRLLTDWRLATDRYRTADEWGQLLCNLLQLQKLEPAAVGAIAVACVVPPLESVLERMCRRYFGVEPLFIGRQPTPGIKIVYETPADVGADRIANAVAAVSGYGPPCVIIDFGTATTFDAVDEHSQYVGGAICPGVGISSTALFEKAARLPRVDLVKPEKVIGTNTVGSMQAGLYYGYLELVRGIVERMRGELGAEARVIVTGGYARVFAEDLGDGVVLDHSLTLEGLRLIYEAERA